MKKIGLLNSELSYEISKLGHGDTICIADCGLPIPENTKRIDLAVSLGIPSFNDVFWAVDSETKFDTAYVAKEAITNNKEFFDFMDNWCRENDVKLVILTHSLLKERTRNCKAVIRTGECLPYCNVILESGVIF